MGADQARGGERGGSMDWHRWHIFQSHGAYGIVRSDAFDVFRSSLATPPASGTSKTFRASSPACSLPWGTRRVNARRRVCAAFVSGGASCDTRPTWRRRATNELRVDQLCRSDGLKRAGLKSSESAQYHDIQVPRGHVWECSCSSPPGMLKHPWKLVNSIRSCSPKQKI